MVKFNNDDFFIVTGANSGIGKSIALKISELGGTVIAVGRNIENLNKLKEDSNYGKNIHIEVKDLVEDVESIDKWFTELKNRFGKFRGMVLSAGLLDIIPINALSLKKAKSLFDINYFVNLYMCKYFSDNRNNVGEGASIVVLSSIASIKGDVGIINYSASKGAINSMVKSMAVEFSKKKIRVNSVLPGFVLTEMIDKWKNVYTDEYIESMNTKYPLGIGKPEYIADTVCFLLSDSAKWITGQNISVDGGASIA
ncbi:MAG: hypothetical protein A2086_06065 [Spirochaetes bacterium GWD1_27_9]|nr:MAG: hypothetical protein A2Z98_10725 [Spirochaetes bacterium GWB1_27_13]OHD20355.1 MAG: hypothetical protein A2Y34_10300 [Spirochaetes bacterium GWC1_27_15]OHD35577.1 MAG: hypothetical protein A2086_06065 [Spirochaetes bacterium GWD1_27_9]